MLVKCDVIVSVCMCLTAFLNGALTGTKTDVRIYGGRKYVDTQTHKILAQKRSYNRRRDKRHKRWGIDVDVGELLFMKY